MALIGKIRNNMWLVFIIITLATASFILMDASGPGGGGGGLSANSAIGTVGGEKISQKEFEDAYSILYSNTPNPNAGRANLWEYMVEEQVVKGEAASAGLGIGRDELMELQFGSNLSPVIRNNFSNPQTGQLDVNRLQQIKNQFESGQGINPEMARFWWQQEKRIKKEQLQTKLSSMVSKAIYTPNWLAEAGYGEENSQVDMAVVKIPFDNLPTGDITVSDSDISNYMNKNKDLYELKEEKRKLDIIRLNVIPSAKDTAGVYADAQKVIEGFKTTTNDSSYAVRNNGFMSFGYGKAELFDEFYRDLLPTYEVGSVNGPYIIGRNYQSLKVIDKLVLPDSAKARHILRRVIPGNAEQLTEANRVIDSLQTVLSRNKGKFSDLATTFSEDPSSAPEGGDLGYFAQGAIMPLNDVCFISGKVGQIYKVTTQAGVHLVYLEDQKYGDRAPSYKVALVNNPIVPSKETENSGYNVLLKLISSNNTLTDLKAAAASNPALTVTTSPNLGANDYSIPGLGDGNETRDLVKWAFKGSTGVNDISKKVYDFTDPILYFKDKYVLVGLSEINKPGMPSAASMRSQLEFAVLNQLKGEKALASITGSDLNSIASANNASVDTLRSLNLLNNFVAGLGNEPQVLGAAFGQETGGVSAPILGNSGIFVVKTLGKVDAGNIQNISFIKRTMSGNKKSNVFTSLINGLKKKYDVKDTRSLFY